MRASRSRSIAADIEQASQLGTFGDLDLRLAREFWPGPLTIVVPASPSVAQKGPRRRGYRRYTGTSS